jgi:uncharacterized protein YcaQ
MTLADLRRFAVARSLFPAGTLDRALETFGFVQADPIRAPARAQDLTLRHRVHGYRAGDLERHYATLAIEEDVFVNYGFVTRALHRLMHPRAGGVTLSPSQRKRAAAILAFVRERGAVHPRDVDAAFGHGTVTNYWGGSSNATTHLLDLMHYAGSLRVVRRVGGIRVYAAQEPVPAPADGRERDGRIDALVDIVVGMYAPLPASSLSTLIARLRYGAPQWHGELRAAVQRAKRRLAHATVDGLSWYWPATDAPLDCHTPAAVRLLAPFDPVVWDRRRFETLWGWPYRFEAYTPADRRKLGYYALPLVWMDRIVGWGNVSLTDGDLHADIRYVSGRRPRDRGYAAALDAELARMREFLAVDAGARRRPH